MKISLFLFLLLCKLSYGQTREGLSKLQVIFTKGDIAQFKLAEIIKKPIYDSAIVIHYKSAIYFIAKHNDSILIMQNIVVDKLNNPVARKTVKKFIKTKVVFNDNFDSSLIDKVTFDSLFNLGKLSVLNNLKIKTSTITPNSNRSDYYTSTYIKGTKKDEFKINSFWINDPSIVINGWHLKRLVLQLYLNYNHWLIIDEIIKKNGKGYYLLNNLIEFNRVYYYDGKGNFIENYSKQVWEKYFPTQFVAPGKAKPENKFPILPILPKGAKFEDE